MSKIFKKIVTFLVVAALSSSLFACEFNPSGSGSAGGSSSGSSGGSSGGSQLKPGDVELTFVSINDLHGSIEQDENGASGISNTAAAIDKLSANYGKSGKDVRDDIVLFGNGDMFQGTAISNMSRGKSVLEAMNDMRFDGMGLGNHEFDWGLDTITAYFDGDKSNGEANFPLVAANVYKKSANGYIADLSDDDNVVNGLIVEKSGVKVGLIGVIGPCEDSILATMVSDYSFRKDYILERVKTVASELKSDGAEIISLNIHYDDYYNDAFATLEDNGDYLIDIIFNGHSHSTYSKQVLRPDGSTIPAVQGGSNNKAFAYVKLTYSTENGDIVYNNYRYEKIKDSDTDYDEKVETTVRNYKENLIASLPTLATSAVTITDRYAISNYVSKVAITALGTEYFASNYGGLRSTGDITAGNPIKEDAFYKIIPFDNAMYVVRMQGDGIYNFYREQGDYNYYGYGMNAKHPEELEGDLNYYTIAIIDYVYLGTYFQPYMQYVDEQNTFNTQIYLRDLLVEDARLCGLANKRWSYNNTPFITKLDF